MDIKNFANIIKAKTKELDELTRRVLPIKVGAAAKYFFTDNFRRAGFLDGTLKPWQQTRRQQDGTAGAAGRYTPLTSAHNHLMRSIQYTPGNGCVTISNPVPYAALHNEGGTISTNPAVTPKMKRFAWAMFFRL